MPAGWGTDHLGVHACRKHGGLNHFKSGPANPAFKHGRYSKFHSPDRLAEFETWRQGSGTEHDQLSAEDEWGLFCLEDHLAQHGHQLAPLDLSRLLNEIADLRLKAQKLRGGEKAQELNVNLNARDELIGRITGLAARRRESSGVGEPE